jgi:hypothetical protein
MTYEEYRKGLKIPPDAQQNAKDTVAFINDVMKSMPGELRVSSTVRDAKRNAQVGGVPNSKHLNTRAHAVDFMPIDGKFTKEREARLRTVCNRHEFGLLVHDVSTGLHYHCEYRGKKR